MTGKPEIDIYRLAKEKNEIMEDLLSFDWMKDGGLENLTRKTQILMIEVENNILRQLMNHILAVWDDSLGDEAGREIDIDTIRKAMDLINAN